MNEVLINLIPEVLIHVNKICLNNFGTKDNTIVSLQSAFEKSKNSTLRKYKSHTINFKSFKKYLVVEIKALTFALQ